MKIYISGKITGDKDYKHKFKVIEEYLIRAGHSVMNPAILPDGFSYDEYMRICFAMLDVCDAIYMIADWKQSEGARKEYNRARWLGKDVIFEEENTKEQQVEWSCQ